ncbi:5'-3' exoribonuclease 1 isoform X1 [Daphnia magna]|uniref:5'-3' exoribonuclease 1 isoform X1 n=1 Tax=Daphnia magna TaxID=35525 RepID=UPI001E1BDE27|nr:5'-3' exoribonuclease 1 isoform X1 [Daphnia magna]
MGVPKFYRWISERYPCLSETVKEYQIPEFDNLYLDMNGIIHNCSHPNDEDVHFRISEEKIFSDIFHYLEVLFRLIRPQKVFFMAIDGVAPRAKMNQQRGRRFRSAKEAEDKEKEAIRKGEVLPEEKRFDSNCITPGTEFMESLQQQLEFFVTNKVSTDPLWQNTQVILSGHQVPGEGEHKIMEFIRFQRSQPDYNAETRHCLYGLDADLMMLGLCSHEPYFSLLREEVRFGGKKNEKRITTPEETTFHLLHLSLFREYLDLEFASVKPKLKFPYDLEHIIDDWVLMGFLVGNDFIPNLPHFHINKGALPLLYTAYIEVLPTLDGYINENGMLNLPRFEKFMERLTLIDYEHFNDIYADVKWLESRHGRKKLVETEFDMKPLAPAPASDTASFLLAKAAEVEDMLREDSADSDENAVDKLLSTPLGVIKIGEDTEPDIDDEVEENDEEGESYVSDGDDYTSSDEDKQFQLEFKAHKRNYYMEKMEYSEVDSGVLRDQAEGYVLAIQWILHYYYNGVCSWSWYYPHHYAPYVSDVRNFANLELKYDLGQPFLPYEQLLGVLPAASKALLPVAHHSLMSSIDSPIIDYYPSNFQTDKNGKQQEWEAVVLIPFIDEKRLISAMKDCDSRLSEEERNRNRHGPMQVYIYTEEDLGECKAPAYFPPIAHNHALCKEITRDAFVMPPERLVKALHPRFNPDRFIPGFPSTKNLSFTATLKKSSICVFNMNTLNESLVLTLVQDSVPDIHDFGKRYCGNAVFVSWPHLQEARVVAVASTECKYSFEIESFGEGGSVNYKIDGEVRKMPMTPRDVDEWHLHEKEIRTRYANRWGVDIGTTHILIYAAPITGRKYVYTQNGRVTLEKQWSPIPIPYALQATVKELQVKEACVHQFSTLAEVFPPNSTCFMLGHPGYGLKGRVLSADKNLRGKIRIEFDNIHELEDEEAMKRSSQCHYMPGYVGAKRLGISTHLISRITGTIYLLLSPTEEEQNSCKPRRPRKVNVGLSLKFNKSKEEIPGWSKKADSGWLYSINTIKVLERYINEFPDFFDFLSQHTGSDDFTDEQVFGEGGTEKAHKLYEFVQTLACTKAERRGWGSDGIDSNTLSYLVKQGPPKVMKLKPLVMQVRPHLLYKPDLMSGSTPPDPSANYQLLDRVVNVRQGYSVPLGLRGTVIGIKNATKLMDVIYEILFDEEFSGALPNKGIQDAPNRIYHLPVWAMINLTHGIRQHTERERQGKPTAVVRPSGSGLGKQPQAAEGPSGNQPKQNYSSYKASLEHQPGQTRQVPQPKLLMRKKVENPPAPTPGTKSATSSVNHIPVKSAPSPSSLPSPFMDIWNSLVQQHEQQQQQQKQQQGSATTHVVNTQETPKQKQQFQSKKREPPVPVAPKLPSLQEAARNLPKITNLPKGPSAAPPVPSEQPINPHEVVVKAILPAEVALQAIPPPPLPTGISVPVGPSLSVQQLFDMASQSAITNHAVPRQPPPPVFSFCLQLMDVMQQKGFGLPVYNYLLLQDGSIMAEVSVLPLGVVGRCAAKSKNEAAEQAAAMALHNPIVMQPMVVPPTVHHPGNVMFVPHPPTMPFGAVRAPVPNSFVPMQVTRQSVQHQPRAQTHPLTPASSSSSEKQEMKEVPKTQVEQVPPVDKGEQFVSVASAETIGRAPIQNQPISSSRPPGSRLAIRFNGP